MHQRCNGEHCLTQAGRLVTFELTAGRSSTGVAHNTENRESGTAEQPIFCPCMESEILVDTLIATQNRSSHAPKSTTTQVVITVLIGFTARQRLLAPTLTRLMATTLKDAAVSALKRPVTASN